VLELANGFLWWAAESLNLDMLVLPWCSSFKRDGINGLEEPWKGIKKQEKKYE